MVAALWLLVVTVVVTDPGDPMAASLEATLRQALEGVSEVIVAPAFDAAPAGDTRAVVHLVVTVTGTPGVGSAAAEATTATLRLVAEGGAELTRQVVFSETDTPRERGRTLAFVALSMLPDVSPADVVEPRRAPPPDGSGVPASSGTALARPPIDGVTSPPRLRRVGLELRGVAALGLADAAATTSFGGALAFVWVPWPSLGLRADVSVRAGDIDAVQASTLWVAATVGASFVLLRTRKSIDLDLEAWLGVGVGRQSLRHFSVGDLLPDSQSVWAFVGRAGLALAWTVRAGFALLVDVGAEFFGAKIPVFVAETLRATLEPVRPILGVGLRVSL